MSEEIYGVDPDILNNSTLVPRSAPTAGIGFGTPREFTFQHGQPLDTSIWTTNIASNWTVEPNDGFLRFQGVPWSEVADIAITRAFSLSLASVTVAFKIRVNQISQLLSGFYLEICNSLALKWEPNSTSPSYVHTDTESRLGVSQIQPDGQWHSIVINIQPGVIILWEDDQHVFTWPPTFDFPSFANLWFTIGSNDHTAVIPPNTAATSIDISNITALVGTTQQTRLRLDGVNQSSFETALPYVRGLARYIPDVVTAAKPVTDVLSGQSIGPSSMFFGKDPGPAAAAAVQRLTEDSRLTTLMTAARAGALPVHPVIYVGIGVNLSFFATLGASIGFLIGTGPNRYTLFSLVVSGGVITNVGAQAVVEVGLFLHQEPSQLLRLGSYMQVGGGEFIQGSLGISGNFPPHLDTWDNCGPALSLGIGLSVSSADIGAGMSYTWEMARL
jgi:hypothetical protein